MGLFTTRDTFEHTTVFRHEGTHSTESSRAAALAVLHDHDFFLTLDDLAVSHEPVVAAPDAVAPQPQPLPQGVAARAGETKSYDQAFAMPAAFAWLLPGGLQRTTNRWDVTNTADGLFARMVGALDVSVERDLRLVASSSSSSWKLVETVTIGCPRGMLATMRKRVEAKWRDEHAKYVSKMGGEVGEQV